MAEISTIARPYSTGIFSLAKENKQLSEWSKMLQMLSSVMSHDEVASIVFDPKILDSDKEKLITDILNKDLTPEGVNLVKLLVENKRLAIVGTISKLFDELKDSHQGSIEAELIFATKPEKKEVNELIESLQKKFEKKIEANVIVDEGILGGSIIHVGDTVIDASVKGQLLNLAYDLKA